jgi:hypothetical protein
MVDKLARSSKALVYNLHMKNWKQGVAILLLIVAPVAIYLLWPTDEARIRGLIHKEARALEAEDMEAVLKGISYNYSDDKGMSYLLIKRILEREFKKFNNLKISTSAILIEVKKDKTASAVMDLRVTAETLDQGIRYVLGDADIPAVLNLSLEKSPSGRWLIRSTKWPPVF